MSNTSRVTPTTIVRSFPRKRESSAMIVRRQIVLDPRFRGDDRIRNAQ